MKNDASIGGFVQELTNCQGDLFFYIRALCGDPDDAADIRQTVNLILWQKRGHFQMGTSFKSWAFRVAQLEVKTFFRKNSGRKTTVFEPAIMDCIANELTEVVDELPERRVALRVCLKKLTLKDTELIKHRYWSSEALNALANRTKRSLGTLKARLFQLRESLRRCIRRQMEGDAT
jgi:RNA polymerase sigma-70 factor (ECF subfamily)